MGKSSAAISPTRSELRIDSFSTSRTPPEAGLSAETAIVALISALACAALTIYRGQDINWDQLNYHIYSLYALFGNRLGVDIAPSQLQTWTNPVGNLIPYFLVRNFNPLVASTILSILASTTVPLIYLVTRKSLASDVSRPIQILIATIAAAGAFSSATFWSEIGSTFNDYFTSILIFLASYLLLRYRFGGWAFFISGLLIGLACGIKLTNIIFLFAWAVAVVVVTGRRALLPLFATGLGSVLAYLPSGGLWNAYIYSLFGNPLFPLYNNVFKSPAYLPVSALDTRFNPKSLVEALQYFPKIALGLHPTSELEFFDSRFLVAGILLVIAAPRILTVLAGPLQEKAGLAFERRASLFLISFFVVSFAGWLWKFGIERYALMLEQLAPLFILILLSLLCADRRVWAQAAIVASLLVFATTRSSDFGHVPFGKSWYDIDIPAELGRGETLFVMLSGEPISYVIPSLPPSDAFVRVEGNLPLDPAVGLGALALDRIRTHQGEIRSLGPADYDLSRSGKRLASFGLAVQADDCLPISTKAGKLKSCRLKPI